MGDDKDRVSRAAVPGLLEGQLDGELTGAGSEAIRACWKLVRNMRAIPSDAGQCEVESLREALGDAITMLDYAAEVLRAREVLGTAELMADAANKARTALKEPDQC